MNQQERELISVAAPLQLSIGFFLTEEDKCVNKVVTTFVLSRAAAERPTKHELQLVRSRETNFQSVAAQNLHILKNIV